MITHVLLYLLDKLGKSDEMRTYQAFHHFFVMSLINSIKQEHEYQILFII